MQEHEDFLFEWFGPWGRELGIPERFFMEKPDSILRFIESSKQTPHPLFISVQPYNSRDQPCAIEKLFFDFDCKEDPVKAWLEAKRFAETLKRFYKVEPLIVCSGCKGYHVYTFLNKTVQIEAEQLQLAKKAYAALQKRLLRGLNFETLDMQPIGDLKRLSRLPFSYHEKTGGLCCPVTLNRDPYVPENLEFYRTLDASLFKPVIAAVKAEDKLQKNATNGFNSRKKGIRPCIQAALSQQLTKQNGHLMRLAVAREYLAAGYGVDEVVSLFRGQGDFNAEKTRYHVLQAQRNPAKPFKCSTIRQLGYCLPSCGRTRK